MDITSYILGKKSGGGGGGSTDPNKTAYRTQTTTEMNNLTTMKENDLCVVYSDTHDELTIPTTSGQTFYFPKNVILDTPITAEDSVTTGSGMGNYTFTISPTLFKVEYKVFVTTIQMQYSSTDGKNYTRTTNTNSLKINKSLTQDAIWLHYFMFPNRQTEYNGTYSYGVNSTWGRVPVTNLTPSNVKENVEILGIIGTYAGDNAEKDVNFYDYLGNLVYSYTAQDFLNLSQLPEAPIHEGMTFQEWNWQLSEAKTYVTKYGMLDIGETCVTSDGKTRIYVTLPEGGLNPQLGLAVNGSVTIDWGDNSTSETMTGSSTTTRITTTHNYSKSGQYVITITSSVEFYFVEYSSGSTTVAGILLEPDGTVNVSIGPGRTYSSYIKKIELGTYARLGDGACNGLGQLKSINIPNTITSIGSRAFRYAYSLKILIFPRRNITLGANIANASGVELVILSNTITAMPQSGFLQCNSLKRFYYPSSITRLEDYMVGGTKISKIIPPQVTVYNSRGILADNTYVKEVTLPENLQTISSQILGGSAGITKIEIPATVTSLVSSSFSNMYSLSCIKFLGNYSQAFQGGWGAPAVRIVDMRNNTSIPSVSSSYSFNTKLKIIVPDALYETWITTGNWPNFVNHIVKASEYIG